MMKIDGKLLAQEILDDLKPQVEELKKKGVVPTMAVILMGDNEDSVAYIRQKELKAQEIGAQVKVSQFPTSIDYETIQNIVKKLNADSSIHGIILQRPAPVQVRADELEELIDPVKEIDGFGKKTLYTVPVAEAVYRMILKVVPENKLLGSKIAVLGKGETAGLPIIKYLKRKGVEPEIIDSKTQNREEILKNADIVISAVGKQNVLKASEIKGGATIIGVGLSMNEEGKLRGDFSDRDMEESDATYTPTPGGVGPVNVAILMENLVKAATSI